MNKNMFCLPKNVEVALNLLENNGFSGYVVGGCVRDLLLGLEPHDYDITTSALPRDIINVFSEYKTIATGIKHGTVTVVIDDIPLEITTYRIDGNYEDNRHPTTVEFVSDLKLDLMRRDFTINAMAYNHKDGLIDLFGGIKDIDNKLIRCVGNPDDRFNEDALRIIRALRFALNYEFDIELSTYNSMIENCELLKNISRERICSEFTKVLHKANLKPNGMNTFCFMIKCIYNILGYDLPESNYYMQLGQIKDLESRLAIVFSQDCNMESILKKLRFPNDVIKKSLLIKDYGFKLINKVKYDSKNITFITTELLFLTNDICCEEIIYFAAVMDENNKAIYSDLIKSLEQCRHTEVYKYSSLKINGNDLIENGITGERIGAMLKKILYKVMKKELPNNKEILINFIKRNKKSIDI